VIVQCPRCATALSKSEQEVASGALIRCNHCGNEFRPPSPAAASGAVPAQTGGTGQVPARPGATSELPPFGRAPDTAPFPAPGQLGGPAGAPLTPVATPVPVSASASAPVPAARRRAIDDTTGIMGYADPSGAHPVVAMPRGTGPSEWTDVKTEVLGSRGPTGGLGRATGSQTRRLTGPPGAAGNAFPSASAMRFLGDLRSYLRLLPWRRKLALGAIVLGPWLVLALILAALSPEHGTRHSLELQPLMMGPGTTEYYPQLGWVERGGRLELVQRAGDWSLVHDQLGRSGYVAAHATRKEPPPAVPSQPFADCLRAPAEINGDRCKVRADEQLESCRKSCGGDADDPSCLEHCQKRFADCLSTCEKPAGPVTLPLAPAAVETPRPRVREPAADAAKPKKPVAPAKPAPAPAKTTKKKPTGH
jgi:hypothetical protein